LSTTNPTWPDLGSNPSHRSGKSATNRLSYGTTLPYSETELFIILRISEIYCLISCTCKSLINITYR
jgi:hypothetical protein